MSQRATDPATRCIHPKPGSSQPYHVVAEPIFQTSTFSFPKLEDLERYLKDPSSHHLYTRYENPTIDTLQSALADLEGTEAALALASGMAAVSTAVMAGIEKGEHAIFMRDTYGGSQELARKWLPRFGVDVTCIDDTTIETLDRARRDDTRVLYLESPTNPILRLVDLEAVSAWARRHGIVTIVDSTVGGPFTQQPAGLGIDVVVHSATKILGGHSDLLAGAICGPKSYLAKCRDVLRVFGAVLDPFAASQLLRSLKTLPLRNDRINQSALRIARFLEARKDIDVVHYPFLESHPQHALAKKQMSGGGCLVSFSLGDDLEKVRPFVDRLEVFRHAASLGSAESLVSVPVTMSHYHVPREQRLAMGITDGLVRLSVGLEDPGDLEADLEQALS
ncbi:MAG: aminotransferase class I/II-fold pyridoxal phosphate-dependent enzyme [Planctomycetota bacterium]